MAFTIIKDTRTNTEKLITALSSLTNQLVTCIHDEANRYAFKTFDGKWHTISFDFANDIARLGNANVSKL